MTKNLRLSEDKNNLLGQHIAKKLADYINSGRVTYSFAEFTSWQTRLYGFLEALDAEKTLLKLKKLDIKTAPDTWEDQREVHLAFLEGKAIQWYSMETPMMDLPSAQAAVENSISYDATKVFLVHGHDEAAKESVARFLERLGLKVVILHEQANGGLTVIEKFEQHAKVGFAVVLLTPDDVGASAKSLDKLAPRARQNVVLELGYFTGKLGRQRVCGLFKSGLEIPSDFHGVVLTELDSQGGWKAKIAQELVSAQMKIDLQGLLNG